MFQTRWIIARKHRALGLAVHLAVVLGIAWALTGGLAPLAFALLGGLHLALDFAKERFSDKGLGAFTLDQLGHLVSLGLVAGLFPQLFDQGLWRGAFDPPLMPDGAVRDYLYALILLSGLIAAVRVAGFALALFFRRFDTIEEIHKAGLKDGGLYIGYLERLIVFCLVLAGEVRSVGFLIAAKSVLRFGPARDRRVSEYVIIGTLASYAWALIVGWITAAALARFVG